MLVSNQTVFDADFLLVDMEPQYVQENDECMGLVSKESRKQVKRVVDKRSEEILKNIIHLKKTGATIFATHKETLMNGFSSIVDVHIPYWEELEKEKFSLYFRKEKPLMVGGLWLERCVFEVARRLSNENIKAVIMDTPRFSLESGLIGDEFSVAEMAKWKKVNLENIR